MAPNHLDHALLWQKGCSAMDLSERTIYQVIVRVYCHWCFAHTQSGVTAVQLLTNTTCGQRIGQKHSLCRTIICFKFAELYFLDQVPWTRLIRVALLSPLTFEGKFWEELPTAISYGWQQLVEIGTMRFSHSHIPCWYFLMFQWCRCLCSERELSSFWSNCLQMAYWHG